MISENVELKTGLAVMQRDNKALRRKVKELEKQLKDEEDRPSTAHSGTSRDTQVRNGSTKKAHKSEKKSYCISGNVLRSMSPKSKSFETIALLVRTKSESLLRLCVRWAKVGARMLKLGKRWTSGKIFWSKRRHVESKPMRITRNFERKFFRLKTESSSALVFLGSAIQPTFTTSRRSAQSHLHDQDLECQSELMIGMEISVLPALWLKSSDERANN